MSFIDLSPSSVGGDSGGRSLGTASGRITIDTSDARNARVTMQQVGRDIAQSVKPIQTELKRAQSALRDFRGELTGIGLAGGVLSGLGLNMAASLEETQIQLTGMVGSQEKAVALMEQLREQAARAGVPFRDMAQAARILLPTLEGNTEELERWFDLVRRTAVLNPAEGIAGAAFAINEALSSGGTDLVSLRERFNIPRGLLKELTEETGDFGEALNETLNRLGITTETADKMGQTGRAAFRAAKDAATQLLAEGFTPLLQTVTPLLQQLTAFLSQVRQTNPAISQFAAGIAGIAAVGAPSLLLLNQMVEAAEKLKALGLLAGAGRAGAIGLGVGLGVVGGQQVLQGIGQATGDQSLANITIQETLFQAAGGLTKIVSFIDRSMVQVATIFLETVASFRTAVGQFAQELGDMLPGRTGLGLRELGENAVAETQQKLVDQIALLNSELAKREQDRFESLDRLMGVLLPVQPTVLSTPTAPTVRGAVDTGFNQDQLDAIRDWADGVQEIERNAAQARLQATQQFESQRNSIIENYQVTLVREAQDFARQRLRQEQQLQRSIERVRQDAIEREADWIEDFNERVGDLRGDSAERIADLREDSAERIEDIERDHNRRMEELQRNHRLTLLEAASRLDARAIAQENRQFNEQVNNLQSGLADRLEQERENLAERIEQEQENLQERLEQEQEAHEERLQEAREADEERIRDMQEALREQQRIEDEDRKIRLERMEEDHQRQLDQLKRAHIDRLLQIKQQAADERRELNEAFIRQMNDLGIHNKAWQQLQKKRQQESLELFKDFWDDFEKEIEERYREILSNLGKRESLPTRPGQPTAFRSGGSVDYTGLALVHGTPSRPEYVLSPETTQAVSQVLGRGFTQPELVQALGGRRGVDIAGPQTTVPGFQIPRLQTPRINAPLQLPQGALEAIMRMAGNMVAPQVNVSPAPVVAAGGRSVSLNLSEGAIQVSGAGDPGQVARIVQQELIQVFRSVGQ